MKQRCLAVWAVVVQTLVLGLAAGCEAQHSGAEADFTNQSATPVDIYRNDVPQFTLMPADDQSCDMAAGDAFSVVDQATQRVRGTYRIEAPDDVLDFTLIAVIHNNHVDWLTRLAADVNTSDVPLAYMGDLVVVNTIDSPAAYMDDSADVDTDDTPDEDTADARHGLSRRPLRKLQH